MIIWCCLSRSTALTTAALAKLSSDDGNFLSVYPSDTLLQKMLNYCQAFGVAESVSILIDIYNKELIDSICRILHLPNLERRPRFIVLSTLLTWGGKQYESVILDASSEFCNRRPIAGAEENWKAENCLWNTASKYKTDITFLSFGLLYGYEGLDFKEIFRSAWVQSTGAVDTYRIPSTLNGRNRIPAIHFDDAVNLISFAVQYGAKSALPSQSPQDITQTSPVSPSSIKVELPSRPVYIPAVDTNEQPLVELFPNLQYCTNMSEVMDAVFESERIEINFWSTDIAFVQPIYSSLSVPDDIPIDGLYSKGLTNHFSTLWNQYLKGNNLSPVKIVVVGGPKTGKTSIAQEIATRLNLEYINVISAVKLVLDNEDDLQEGCDMTAPIIQLRLELLAAVEAAGDPKKGGGKGKKDKAPTENIRLNSTNVDLSEALCSAIADGIIRRCINWRIKKTSKCELSGYVLDAWAPFISSYEQLSEAVIIRDSNPDDQSSSVALDLSAFAEVIIELQCIDAVASKRYLEIIGGVDEKGKISKESQALLKTLEASQQAYNEKMKPIASLDNTGPIARAIGDDVELSHIGVLSVASGAPNCGILRLLRTAVAETSTIAALTERAVDGIIKLHGPLGWYSTENSAKATAGEDVATNDGLNQEENENIDDSDDVVLESTASSGAAVNSSGSVMDAVNTLGTTEKDILSKKVSELQQYLLDNVLPHLARGMVRISRDQPDDPIGFLESYIRTVAIQIETSTVEKVRDDFYRTIRETEQNQAILKG